MEGFLGLTLLFGAGRAFRIHGAPGLGAFEFCGFLIRLVLWGETCVFRFWWFDLLARVLEIFGFRVRGLNVMFMMFCFGLCKLQFEFVGFRVVLGTFGFGF